MRLTLRTLLAYLDDRLSAAHAREIGQKIAGSPFATDLVERIRNVVRRRRLASPDRQQKLIDANLIAEYLDDQLTPELVTLLEKELLSSDVALAEVAASHQVLGLLGEPAEIEPALKERLYRLASPADSGESAADEQSSGPPPEAAAEWAPMAPQTASEPRWPIWLLAACALIWLGLVATDTDLLRSDSGERAIAAADAPAEPNDARPETAAADSAVPGADTAVADAGDSNQEVVASEPEEPSTAAVMQPAASGSTDDAQDPTDMPAPTENAAADPAVAATTQPEPPMTNTGENPVVSAAASDPSDPGDAAAAVQEPPDAVVRPARFIIKAGDGVILQQNEEQLWQAAATDNREVLNTLAESGALAAVPAPLKYGFSIDKSGWAATAVGPALMSLSAEEQGVVSVYEGRLVVVGEAADDSSDVHLQVSGAGIQISLLEAGSIVGVEVVPGSPFLAAADNEAGGLLPLSNSAELRVEVARGRVSVDFGNPEPQVLSAGRVLTANCRNGDAEISSVSDPQQLAAVSDWVQNALQSRPQTVETTVRTFVGYLSRQPSVVAAAGEAAKDRNPDVASMGAGLIAALRESDQLISLLADSEFAAVRQEAIAGLKAILQQSAVGPNTVRLALNTRLNSAETEDAMKLLTGLYPVDAADAEKSQWLVRLLDSGKLAVRELAIFNLKSLTGETFGYFADADTARRRDAVRRWERVLDRNDGALTEQ